MFRSMTETKTDSYKKGSNKVVQGAEGTDAAKFIGKGTLEVESLSISDPMNVT